MSHHVDYKPLAIHENDNDLIREVTVIRYQLFDKEGKPKNNLMYPSKWELQNRRTSGEETILEVQFHKYCLVDPQGRRRSHWFDTKEGCEEYALVYPPDKRPDFGKDEYDRP